MIKQLGRYEIVGELGHGAMGTVYSAKDPLIGRPVAIKTINLGLMLEDKDEYEGRFYQEAKAAGCLSHPNIVTIYDVGKSEDVAYIAMEFLEGRELRDILNDGERLSVAQALEIMVQVAQGLDYAHDHGIIHRDVKPSNIMVIRDGHVKITDFGIARMASSAVRTQTGMVLGSPKYMSPEQVMGQQLDPRSDIFSLGVMLYELITGKTPFNGENISAIMYQTVNTAPPTPSTLNAEVPEMLDLIVAKAIAKKQEDRYQSARELVDDLKVCREKLPQGMGGTHARLSSLVRSPQVIAATKGGGGGEEQGSQPVAKGLSHAFDSSGATKRLAEMTHVAEDFSKTIKLERNAVSPLPSSVAPAKPVRVAPAPAPRMAPKPVRKTAEPRKSTGKAAANSARLRNWLMLFAVLMILFGLFQLVGVLLF